MQSIISLILVFGLSLFMSTENAPIENPCNIMFPRNGDDAWGDGLYLLSNNTDITVYKDKFGGKFGKLSKANNYFKFKDTQNKQRSIKAGDIEYIGHYSMSFLKVKGSTESNYIQVFWNTFGDKLYVKKTDLVKQKAKFYSYKELLYNKNISIDIEEYRNWASLGVNLNGNCLNLRKGPSTSNAVIRCISKNKTSGQEFSHFSILETKKDWAKVEVVTYVMTDAAQSECDYSEHKKEIGWIKAMDDNGFPNIWYSVTNI